MCLGVLGLQPECLFELIDRVGNSTGLKVLRAEEVARERVVGTGLDLHLRAADVCAHRPQHVVPGQHADIAGVAGQDLEPECGHFIR